jgi:hypothetical protein
VAANRNEVRVMTATIVVRRDSGYADRLRDYRILIDGVEIGRVGNGATQDFQITSSPHQLMIKVDWGRSNIVDFDIGEGQTVRIVCGSNLRGWRIVLALYYATFGFRSYLWLKAE